MASSRSHSHPQRQRNFVAWRALAAAFATVAGLFCLAVISGCGNSDSSSSSANPGLVSALVLHGTYIEGQTGQNFALDFDSNGASLYDNVKEDPSDGRFVGNCIVQGGQYSLIGDTVRASGGTLTQYGQAEALITPPSGGNVMLFKLVNSGQELDFTRSDGSILQFIRQ